MQIGCQKRQPRQLLIRLFCQKPTANTLYEFLKIQKDMQTGCQKRRTG